MINGHYALGQKLQAKIGRLQRTLHAWWKWKIAYTVAQIDDYVKHIFKEHNLETDHLANLWTIGQRKKQLKEKRTQRTGRRSEVSRTAAKKRQEGMWRCHHSS